MTNLFFPSQHESCQDQTPSPRRCLTWLSASTVPPFVSQKEGLARPRPHVLLPEAPPRRGGAAPGPANPDSMVHQRTATLGSKNEGVAGHPTIRDAPSELGFHSGHVREENAFLRKRGEKVRTRLCPTPRPGPSGRGAGGGRGPGVPRSATECIPFCYLFSVLRPGGV